MPEKETIEQRHREVAPANGSKSAPPAEPGEQQRDQRQKDNQPEQPPKPPLRDRASAFVRRHRLGIIAGAFVLIAALIGLVFLLRYFHSYESTDDAFIDGHLDPIGSRIAGTVIAVHAENNQYVTAGEVLVELDSRDYEIAVVQARATFEQARLQVRAENPNIPIITTTTQSSVATAQADITAAEAGVAAAQQEYQARLADIQQAQAQNAKAQTDLARYRLLVQKDEISKQQFDAVSAAAQSQAALLQASEAAAEAARKQLDQRRAQLVEAQTRLSEAQTNAPRQISVRRADVGVRQASVQAAQAQLDQALLNLSYTKIVAPVAGVVTSRTAQIGERVQPGESLLSISEVGNVWVTANFKETQLQRMHPGQSVQIHVDAFDQTFDGYVADMPGASGAVTSLLPPENATGNFVKVVQRLPVRILLKPGQDPQHRLRPGMSCEPKVWL